MSKRYGVGRTAKQDRLPGVDDPVIKEIEDAAHDYEQARDARVAATKPEVETKENLIIVMKQNGKKLYRRGELIVKVRPRDAKATVKVMRKKQKKNKEAA